MEIGTIPFENSLPCPLCNEDNLHQEKVEVMFRDIEDGHGNLVIAKPRLVTCERSGRLPGRRNTLYIFFSCEHCHGGYEPSDEDAIILVIQQHKGTTYVWWGQTPELEKVHLKCMQQRLGRFERTVPLNVLDSLDEELWQMLGFWIDEQEMKFAIAVGDLVPDEPPEFTLEEPSWLKPYGPS